MKRYCDSKIKGTSDDWKADWQIAERYDLREIVERCQDKIFKFPGKPELIHPPIEKHKKVTHDLCQFCFVSIKSSEILKHLFSHKDRCISDTDINCVFCDKQFHRSVLQMHMEVTHSELYAERNKQKVVLCQFCCVQISPPEVAGHMLRHQHSLPICSTFINCAYCGECMPMEELLMHMKSKANIKKRRLSEASVTPEKGLGIKSV